MPLFDPLVERYDSLPIWVKLPNLSFEFWSLDIFNMIGNLLGTFLEADLSFLSNGICCLGKVLVLLDLRNGLANEIVIQKGDNVFSQPIDYVRLPFRCNCFQLYGHLLAHCHLPLKKNGLSLFLSPISCGKLRNLQILLNLFFPIKNVMLFHL